MKSISVIIPTWNREKTIEHAVKSALNQTLEPIEVLVSDDGSIDNSKYIIDNIIKKDDRVKWIAGEHAGRPAIPRNRGIKESKGEWLAFLDSDDEWMPDKLEKQIKLADKLKCKAICSNALIKNPNDEINGKLLTWNKKKLKFIDLLQTNYVVCSSAVVNRSIFNQISGFPEEPEFKAIEDYVLWLKVSTLTDFAFLEETLVIYLNDEKNSIRGKAKFDPWLQKAIALKDLVGWIQNTKVSRKYKNIAKNSLNFANERLQQLNINTK